VPGPGLRGSACKFSLLRTVLPYDSLPVPKQNVLGPLQWTAKVEVVLFGLKTVGILYASGGGEILAIIK